MTVLDVASSDLVVFDAHFSARVRARSFGREALDRVLAALLLLAGLPLFLFVVAAIRVTSRGPALYRQERVGWRGRTFQLVKFRTMTVGAAEQVVDLHALNEGAGPLFKLRCDPRVTAVGRLLRRFSIDELPQLVNVIRGEMALVGPRPALPHEVRAYDASATGRLAVKPGLTGLWQVSGRSDLSWAASVRLDLEYVAHHSLGLDLRILGRTVGAVLSGRGAY